MRPKTYNNVFFGKKNVIDLVLCTVDLFDKKKSAFRKDIHLSVKFIISKLLDLNLKIQEKCIYLNIICKVYPLSHKFREKANINNF